LLKAVTDPQADLWALTGEGSERYGGSGEVAGSGEDNEPAAPESELWENRSRNPEPVKELGQPMNTGTDMPTKATGSTPPEPVNRLEDTPPESITPEPVAPPPEASSRPDISIASLRSFNNTIEKDIKRAKKQGIFHLPQPVIDVRSALYGTGFAGFANAHPNYGHMVNYFYGRYGSDPSKWESRIVKPEHGGGTRQGKFLQTENVPFKYPVGKGNQITWSEADLSASRRRKLAKAMAELARQYKYDK